MTTALPFTEALKHLAAKGALPTSLDSAEIAQQLSAAVRRQSVFSARTTVESYLADIKATVESIVNPKQVLREGVTQTVTEGYTPATARAALREQLAKLGYTPEDGEEGTVKDLSSDVRLNLVVKTNTELAQGAGHYIRQNSDADVVDAYPALELTRYEQKQTPRDWESRWRIAAQVAGDANAARVLEFEGRMVALKSSGIWQALGDGAGGHDDTLGNPFPPFAFNSGMWTDEVSRADAEDLGLITNDDVAQPAAFDLATLFEEAA